MAAALPDWMILDRFVFRRDGDASFPDEEAAPSARGTTSRGDSFRVAFRIVEPPNISRLYLQWAGGPKEGSSCDIVAAHRNLLLLRLTSSPVEKDGSLVHPQDYFLCEGRPSSLPAQPPLQLHQIPSCTIPLVFHLDDGRTRAAQRSFHLHSVGMLRHGDKFALAHLVVSECPPVAMVQAELRSKVNSSDHSWEVESHLPITYEGVESSVLAEWRTDNVIPFKKFLCWVCYSAGGVLLCKVFKERPAIEFLPLPICYQPGDVDMHNDINCSVCTTQDGNELMFINVTRDDEKVVGPMSPGTGFVIFGHILRNKKSGCKQWEKFLVIHSPELWDLGCFPKEPLIFPLVNMVKQNVLYFLLSEAKHGIDKASVFAVDITAKKTSILPYITGQEDLSGEDADMVKRKSYLLDPFIPSELPRFLQCHFSEHRMVSLQKKGKKTTITKPTSLSRSRKK